MSHGKEACFEEQKVHVPEKSYRNWCINYGQACLRQAWRYVNGEEETIMDRQQRLEYLERCKMYLARFL